MPLIPSQTLIYSHSLTGLLSSYILLTSPATLLSNAFTPIWLLGESMHIREASSKWTTQASEPVAALALLLALTAVTHAFFASGLSAVDLGDVRGRGKGKMKAIVNQGELGEKVYRLRYAQNQWMGLAGVRVLLMGMLVGWTYVFQKQQSHASGYLLSGFAKTGGFKLLANRAVFAASMMDMLFWGYLWTNVREEGRELAVAVSQLKQQEEEDDLLNS